MSGLPPGQYFAIALPQIPPGTNISSPAFLQSLAGRAMRFDLLTGQSRTIDLKGDGLERGQVNLPGGRRGP